MLLGSSLLLGFTSVGLLNLLNFEVSMKKKKGGRKRTSSLHLWGLLNEKAGTDPLISSEA